MRLKKKLGGIKDASFKSMAVFLGICYLLGPLHSEIYRVLHNVAHTMEVPEQLISHDHGRQHHAQHELQSFESSHQHEILNFLSSMIASTSNGDQQSDPALLIIKPDKHLLQFCIGLPYMMTTMQIKNFPLIKPGTEQNFTISLFRPPMV